MPSFFLLNLIRELAIRYFDLTEEQFAIAARNFVKKYGEYYTKTVPNRLEKQKVHESHEDEE